MRCIKYWGKAVVCFAVGGILSSCTTNPPPVGLNPVGIYAEKALAKSAQTAQVTLAWDASPSPEATSYNILIGTSSGTYSNKVNVGNVLSASIPGLILGRTYYFVATAQDDIGNESEYSNEVSYTPPVLTNHIIVVQPMSGTNVLGPWSSVTNWPAITVTNPVGNLFYKLSITNWFQ